MYRQVYFRETTQYLVLILHVSAAEVCHVQGATVYWNMRKV